MTAPTTRRCRACFGPLESQRMLRCACCLARLGEEQWLPIPGFEGSYSISSLGRVRSEQRSFLKRNGQRHTVRERVLRLHTHPCGTKSVKLARRGDYTGICPHLVVREVFGGDR